MEAIDQTLRKNRYEVFDFIAKIFRGHFLLIAIICTYTLSLFWVSTVFRVQQKISISLYSPILWMMFLCFLVAFLITYPTWIMVVVRPDHLFRFVWYDLKNNYLTTERISIALPILLILPIFFSTFTSFKIILPDINPFSWDPQLARWDQILHGGVPPWKWLQPIFNFPLATCIISFFYHPLWFFVMYIILFWQAFSLSDLRRRMQFFLSFCLIWIVIGTMAAISLSSAGPCFYQKVAGSPDPYRPLVTYLRQADHVFPILSLNVQEALWSLYKNGGVVVGAGISAMPSMHVASATLFALLGWKINRLLGSILTAFALVILVGSVHLAWHYAIDGYVAILVTMALWTLTGWILHKNPKIYLH